MAKGVVRPVVGGWQKVWNASELGVAKGLRGLCNDWWMIREESDVIRKISKYISLVFRGSSNPE